MQQRILTYLVGIVAALWMGCIGVFAQGFKDLPAYRCVKYEQNILQFPGERIRQDYFYSRLDSLLLFHTGEVNIWHVGGSHVQADIFSHKMRSNLTELQPEIVGNRGILFPYSIAHTNYSQNYRTSYAGKWSTDKNTRKPHSYRMGLTGMAASTQDSNARVTLRLNTNKQNTQWRFDQLHIMGYTDSTNCYPYTVWKEDTLRARYDSLNHYYSITLPTQVDSMTIQWNMPYNASFTLTGLIPQHSNNGISYYSSGVNGAAVPAWLRCEDLAKDLQYIRPDLAIFAIGINDAAVPYGSFNPETFKANYRQLIEQVLHASPHCALLFITNNDSYRYVSRRRMTANTNGPLVQRVFYELAQEYGGCVWDLFSIMGGMGSVDNWEEEQLIRPDRLHFTHQGYELLGDLLFNALLTDYLTHSN